MTTIHYSRPTSEQEALDMVSKYPLQLKFLKGQTEEVALAAVKADWRALQYVENRTPEMEAEAIRQNPEMAKLLGSIGDPKPCDGLEQPIVYSRDLSEEQAIRLVEEKPYNFQHIKDPTDAVCEAALKADPWKSIDHIPKDRMTPEWNMIAAQAGCLGKIENPTYEMCLASVRHDGQSLRYVEKEMRTPELLDAAVEQDPAGALYCMRPNEKTPEVCWKAVMKDGKALQYVDRSVQTKQMCMAAIYQDPSNIMYVARQLEDICLEAVRQKGEVIDFITAPSKKVCLEAVRNNPDALKYVRYGHPSLDSREDMFDVYVEAVKLKPEMEDNLGELHEDMLDEAKELVSKLQNEASREIMNPMTDYDVCVEAVKKNGLALQDILKPEESLKAFQERLWEKGRHAGDEAIELHFDRYKKLCEMAVSEKGMALEFVDKDVMFDDEYRNICTQAIHQNPMALKFADKKGQDPWTIRHAVLTDPMSIQYAWRKDADLCRFAVDRNGYALQFIKKQTPELCMVAVNRTPYALKFVKKKTREICRAAVEKDPGTKAFVRDKSMLDELDLAVPRYNDTENMRKVRTNGYELGEIPESERTPEVCRIALEQNPYALKFVPDPTLDMYLIALKVDDTVLEQVQKHRPELLDKDSYMQAVQTNPGCFRYVPNKFKTEEMCMNAVGKKGMNLVFVPEELRTPEMDRLAVENDPRVADHVKLKSEDEPVNAMRL